MRTAGPLTVRLLSAGWQRDNGRPADVEECTNIYGCSRAGRWTHPFVTGIYCAQHAGQSLS